MTNDRKPRAIFLLLLLPFVALAETSEEIINHLKGFNKMRESLASAVDISQGPITVETFEKTCKPVGQAYKEWGAKRGYKVRQLSHKNRNPLNAATPEEIVVMDRFLGNPKLQHFQGDRTLYVRIPVTEACLSCHGPKASLPSFIKEKYPTDKAFDFKPGDLRGLYRVDLPSAP